MRSDRISPFYTYGTFNIQIEEKKQSISKHGRRFMIVFTAVCVILFNWGLFYSFSLSAKAIQSQSEPSWSDQANGERQGEWTDPDARSYERQGYSLIENQASDLKMEENIHSLIVERGDTLWKIAVNYGPDSIDTRDYIDELKRFNRLESSSIFEGQILYLP